MPYNSTETEEGLVMKVNGETVDAEPEEDETSIEFFKRVARENDIKNFEISPPTGWDKDAPASELTGTYDVVKVDKPGA